MRGWHSTRVEVDRDLPEAAAGRASDADSSPKAPCPAHVRSRPPGSLGRSRIQCRGRLVRLVSSAFCFLQRTRRPVRAQRYAFSWCVAAGESTLVFRRLHHRAHPLSRFLGRAQVAKHSARDTVSISDKGKKKMLRADERMTPPLSFRLGRSPNPLHSRRRGQGHPRILPQRLHDSAFRAAVPHST